MTICGHVVEVGSLLKAILAMNPQWLTAIVAFCALIAAIVSIIIQKGIARKRAAIDFCLKTEMDEDNEEVA